MGKMNASDKIIGQNDRNIFSLEQNKRWEEISKHKEEFLKHKKDPFSFLDMDPEVAASWVRSLEIGVDPYSATFGKQINIEEINKIRSENRLLIEVAEPLFKTFGSLARHSKYYLNLDDKNGISLLQEGIDSLPKYHLELTGKLCNEDTIGTNAHLLSKKLARPIQLLGPEHYCLAFQNILATAAPIFNETGEVIAILSLCSCMRPGDNVQKVMEHSLSYVVALSAAIESKFKLSTNYGSQNTTMQFYRTANDMYAATLDLIDEGIITMDHKGNFIHVNKEGLRILEINQNEANQRNIKEFLSGRSNFMNIIDSGANSSVKETLYIGNQAYSYLLNIETVMNQSTNKIYGAVVRFKNYEKSNSPAIIKPDIPEGYCFNDIVGESKAVQSAINIGKLFAKTSESVLLTGESGTGKELFAQAIHNINRPGKPFIAINCAAIPQSLIESELFGYEGGSFTGAERTGRPGKFELANGGTLFLDEIGDMPYELQAVLLRILQDKQVMRIGGRTSKKIDFRIIAATNKDLRKMVKDNLFREDLFYRLSVLSIVIPPLRDRVDDTELLCHFLIKSYCSRMEWDTPQISPFALKRIKEYHWPGNVRELENAMIYAVNIAQGEIIESKHLPEYILLENDQIQFADTTDETTENKKSGEIPSWEDMEKRFIESVLIKTKYNIPQAAALLKMSKSTVYRKIKEYQLEY